MRSVINKICLSVAVVGVLGCSVFAQVNILSDVVQFRNSVAADGAKVTTHYGRMVIQGKSPDPGSCLSVTENTAGNSTYAISGYSRATAGMGTGGYFNGGYCGVLGAANSTGGSGNRRGGVFLASGGASNYGVWAQVSGAGSNWAGYFTGNVYSTGTFTPSDEKLKMQVTPLTGSLVKILQLKPKGYLYDVDRHPKMNLPRIKQNGLVAQEVETVFPEVVTTTVEPSTDDNGAAVGETFKSVNYTALIPVMIAAMQEQQSTIQDLQSQINELKKVIAKK